MAKKDRDPRDSEGKKKKAAEEGPVDLLARIGTRPTAEPDASARDVPPEALPPPQRLDGPLPSRRTERPSLIGAEEPAIRPAPQPTADPGEGGAPKSLGGAIASRRTPPGPGEIDVVVTPLPTPDDWHRFEIEFRRVRGITQLRPEYYRHGVAKMRVMWEGEGRLAHALRGGIAGFRVRVIGEDRGTLQILVSADNDERRPG